MKNEIIGGIKVIIPENNEDMFLLALKDGGIGSGCLGCGKIPNYQLGYCNKCSSTGSAYLTIDTKKVVNKINID